MEPFGAETGLCPIFEGRVWFRKAEHGREHPSRCARVKRKEGAKRGPLTICHNHTGMRAVAGAAENWTQNGA